MEWFREDNWLARLRSETDMLIYSNTFQGKFNIDGSLKYEAIRVVK